MNGSTRYWTSGIFIIIGILRLIATTTRHTQTYEYPASDYPYASSSYTTPTYTPPTYTPPTEDSPSYSLMPNEKHGFPFSIRQGGSSLLSVGGDGKLRLSIKDSAGTVYPVQSEEDLKQAGSSDQKRVQFAFRLDDGRLGLLFTPEKSGDFTLTVTNVDKKQIEISATFDDLNISDLEK